MKATVNGALSQASLWNYWLLYANSLAKGAKEENEVICWFPLKETRWMPASNTYITLHYIQAFGRRSVPQKLAMRRQVHKSGGNRGGCWLQRPWKMFIFGQAEAFQGVRSLPRCHGSTKEQQTNILQTRKLARSTSPVHCAKEHQQRNKLASFKGGSGRKFCFFPHVLSYWI